MTQPIFTPAGVRAASPLPLQIRDAEAPPEQLTRELSFDIRAGSVDDKSRTVELTFSSEEPYARWWGTEVLDHASGSVRLDRLNAGGALLMDHDTRDQVGVVERAWLKGRKGYAQVRFGKSARAQEVFEDVKDGIRKLVSVGYRIRELVLEKSSDGEETYRATDWEPYEISLVAVPADPSVGVGRDGKPAGFDPRILTKKENDMPAFRNAGGAAAAPAPAPAQGQARAERARVLDLQEMGKRLSLDPALVERAIEEGWSRDQLAAQHSSARGAGVAIRTAEGPAGGRDDFETAKRDFSLTATVKAMAEGKELSGLEREVSQEMRQRNGGVAPRGVLVPIEVLAQRTQLVGTANIGGNLVGTDYRPQDFVEPLRNASAIMQMGARMLTDLVGNVSVPRQTNATSAAWVAEDAAAAKSTVNFDQIPMAPKTVSANVAWSRQMALQGLPAMEIIMRADLAAQLGLAIDLAAINGAGSGTVPRGILQTSGIGSVPIGTNGGAPTYQHIVDLETAVAVDNAATGSLGYLTNTKVRGQLKKTEMFDGTNGNPVWQSGATPLNGYRAGVTNQVPADLTKGTAEDICSAIIFGNWQDLLIGTWGGLDMILDPYTNSTTGRVVLTVFQSVDIAVRHPESFAAILDATTPGV